MPPADPTKPRLPRECYYLTIRQGPTVGKSIGSKPSDAGFFVFGDLSVRPEGDFRLRFVLYELLDGEAICLQWTTTDVFTVYPPKTFPGLQESSFISRSFGDQGVRLRIRKDGRTASKRNAKSQNVGEEGGYETKSQTTTTPTSQQSTMYGAEGYSTRSYAGADPGLVKRQRTSHDFSQGSYERDQWQYSSAPNSAGLYPPSNSTGSGYSHEVVPASQQVSYPYRGGQNPLSQAPASLYQRNTMPEYGHGQQQLGYDVRGGYSHSDPSSGLSQYGDSSGYSTATHSADPSSELSPGSHHSSATYSTLSDPSIRQNLQSMRGPSTQGSNVLPLPYNPTAVSPSGSTTVPSSYNYSTTPDNRYNPQASAQQNMRYPNPGYSGYQMQQTHYQST